jgi:hypothetical protein
MGKGITMPGGGRAAGELAAIIDGGIALVSDSNLGASTAGAFVICSSTFTVCCSGWSSAGHSKTGTTWDGFWNRTGTGPMAGK